MNSLRSVLGLLVLVVTLTACASTGSSSSTSDASGMSPDRIVVDQLDFRTGGLTAYQLVRQYNSQWLQKRGRMSINHSVPIRVYVDNTGSPYGTVSSLRDIRASEIAYIEHYTGSEAQFKFGMDNSSGVIYVETKPAGG